MSEQVVFPERLLKATEIASLLNISRAHAYNLMKRGELPVVKIGESRRVRPEDLAKYIEANTTKQLWVGIQ